MGKAHAPASTLYRHSSNAAIVSLQRRYVRVAVVKYIGKESNDLKELALGLRQTAESIFAEYSDPSSRSFGEKHA